MTVVNLKRYISISSEARSPAAMDASTRLQQSMHREKSKPASPLCWEKAHYMTCSAVAGDASQTPLAVRRYVPAVYNFVTQRRSSLLLRRNDKDSHSESSTERVVPADVLDDTAFDAENRSRYWEVSTLGQFCPGVDEVDSTFFGSERVVDALHASEQWPCVRFYGQRGLSMQ